MRETTKRVILFVVLTFFISWSIALFFYLTGRKLNSPQGLVMAVIYMFIPMIIAIFLQKLIYKEHLRESLDISFRFNRWFFVAWFLPPLIAFAAFGISLLFPGVEFSPGMEGMFERYKSVVAPEQLEKMKNQIDTLPFHPVWIGLVQGLFAGITINAIAGFGEELGWRGFLQKQLSHIGFWKSSLLIGFVWGIWHTPLIIQGHNYPQHPLVGVLMMTIWCILMGPVFSYVRLKAKSVIAAAIIHGSLNGTFGLSIILLKGGNDLIIGATGLAGFIVLVIVNICIFIYNSKFPLTLIGDAT